MPLYHLHVDATALDPALQHVLEEEMGFSETNFTHPTHDFEHYEPSIHLTLKSRDLHLIKARATALKALLSEPSLFSGYIEAEYVALDRPVVPQETQAGPMPPFAARKRALRPGTFRQSEIHVALRTPHLDDPICSVMRSMGYFTALMEKPTGLFNIFTLQGSHRQIRSVLPATVMFLEHHGGFSEGSVKEERIIDWWMSDNSGPAPPVIEDIIFLTQQAAQGVEGPPTEVARARTHA